MAYSTQSDILKRITAQELSELTSEVDGEIDSTVVTEMIAVADAEIDGYIGVRFAVPLASPPKFINGLSVSIALYRLHERRASALGAISEVIKDAYDNALKTLDAIARGKVSIGEPAPAPTVNQDKVSITGSDRIFTTDRLKGF